MKSRIFISHADQDKSMAIQLVSFLVETLNIARDEIFCSCIPGSAIPAGKEFVRYIREQLSNPEVIVILLLTENYFSSVFAVCEMGGTWALGLKWLPLMVPPLQHKDITAVLTGVHVYTATKPEHLGLMRDQLAGLLKTTKASDFGVWEHHVHNFIDRIQELTVRNPIIQLERVGPNDYEVDRATEFYEKIAAHYDRGVSPDFIETHSDLNRLIQGQLSAAERKTTILDLGGGTGRILSAFETEPLVLWYYCDACSAMRDIFTRRYGAAPVLKGIVCQDAEEYLKSDGDSFDIIILSFLMSSMPHMIDFGLLKHRLKDEGLLIVVEANPTYSEKKPRFSITDSSNVKYSLRIRPVDAPSLARNASVVGLKIIDLLSHNKGDRPYSYIANFKKSKS